MNDFTCTAFPILPLDDAGNRFENNVAISLDSKKQATLDSLQITLKTVEVQERTVTQSNSSLWHLLRKKEKLPANLVLLQEVIVISRI